MDNSNRLGKVLELKNISQSKFAKMYGKTRQTINSLCKNKSQPSLKQLYVIAKLLNCSISDLLEPNGNESVFGESANQGSGTGADGGQLTAVERSILNRIDSSTSELKGLLESKGASRGVHIPLDTQKFDRYELGREQIAVANELHRLTTGKALITELKVIGDGLHFFDKDTLIYYINNSIDPTNKPVFKHLLAEFFS